jgi:hypothetical protein
MRKYCLQGIPKVKKDDWKQLVKKTYQEIESSIQRLEKEISPVELTSSQIASVNKIIDLAKHYYINWIENNFHHMYKPREVFRGFGSTYDDATKYLNRFFDIVRNENLSWVLVNSLSHSFDRARNLKDEHHGYEAQEREYQRLKPLYLKFPNIQKWERFTQKSNDIFLYHHDDEWSRANSALLKQYKKALKQKTQDDKKARTKGLASAYQDKTRELATSVKNALKKQLVSDECPYCGNSLGTVPHADHIYPVAEGGLSTIQNMIYICKSCNMKKSDKTLRQFITENNMDREFIENNLSRLDKKF